MKQISTRSRFYLRLRLLEYLKTIVVISSDDLVYLLITLDLLYIWLASQANRVCAASNM